ncbi:MAG: GAF domain-containing protein [Candidatus Nanopelagicales bacterium]|nr:GAF domain-containing protein [Actinomycetota bacterium]
MPRGTPPTHWVAPDLGSVARAVRSAQERFLSGDLGVNGVRSLVLDSWRRSISEGVDPEADAAPLIWAPDQLAAARERSPLQGAMPMIRSLLTQPVEASGHVVAVGDAEGHLLWVEGDRTLRSRAEEMGFVAGAEWSEGVAGTNAPGTALTLNAPVQIFASEHFRGTVQPWSCTAVPIHDPHTGRVLGVLDVTGESQVATPQALAMVRATAMAVEQWLAVQQPAQANAQLLVLGRRRGVLRRDGNEQQLSTRHSELMVLLAATSEGLTGERLAVMLHEHDVPLVTVRAEMARLRKILGEGFLQSRPYRLTEPLVTDAQEVIDALDRGDTRAATTLYAGPLLPTSQSPEIAEMRGDLRARVRRAALESRDADALMQFAVGEDGRDDVEVIQAALRALPASSPKRIGLTARLERLHKLLAVPLPRLPGSGRAR